MSNVLSKHILLFSNIQNISPQNQPLQNEMVKMTQNFISKRPQFIYFGLGTGRCFYFFCQNFLRGTLQLDNNQNGVGHIIHRMLKNRILFSFTIHFFPCSHLLFLSLFYFF